MPIATLGFRNTRFLRLFVPLLISAAGFAVLVSMMYHDLGGFLSAMFLR